MQMRFRQCFLILFVMLQCMAPLLHAHASAAHHAGLHLPAHGDVEYGHGPAWHDALHPLQEGIGVAPSLEARHDALLLPGGGVPPSLPCSAARRVACAGCLLSDVPAPAGSPAHLHPPACAPPRA